MTRSVSNVMPILLREIGNTVELVLDVFERGDLRLGLLDAEAAGVVGVEL